MHQENRDFDYHEGADEVEDDFIDEMRRPEIHQPNITTNEDEKFAGSRVRYSPYSRDNNIYSRDKPTSSTSACSSSIDESSYIRESYPQNNNSVTDRHEGQIGAQAKILLNLFIQHQARETPVEPIIHRLCEVDRGALMHCGLNDHSLQVIMCQLNNIAAEISQNQQIEAFIDSVPNCATKQVFCEVAHKVFADGTINWGRIVMVFYFGCRLALRSLSQTIDNSGWVKEMLSWVVDFITINFAKWIISRGGWSMIKEWVKFTDNVWKILFFGSLMFGLWAYFRKS